MKIKTLKKNNGPAHKNMRSIFGGFTLVETMFAIMILTFTIVGMMTVVSGSLFAARYAKDEITANYLIEEVIDSIRNDRDTLVFLQDTQSIDTAWTAFASKYSPCAGSNGCSFDVLSASTPTACSLSETNGKDLYYDPNASNTAFYTNDNGLGNSGKTNSGFQRKILFLQNGDQITVTVTVSWFNGNLPKSRSLSTTLMKWQS